MKGQFPSTVSKNAEEKKLSASLSGYCGTTSGSYDPEFHQWAWDNGYGKRSSKNPPQSVVPRGTDLPAS